MGDIEPHRPPADTHLDAHERAEERDDLDDSCESIAVAAGVASHERQLLGTHRDGDGLAVTAAAQRNAEALPLPFQDRKSTRLNSSHRTTSYAVFCLKKKKKKQKQQRTLYTT